MEERNATTKKHNLELVKRQMCHMTGVVDVKEFEPQGVRVILEDSILLVKGSELHVERLDIEHGELQLTGRIDSIQYLKRSVLKKKGFRLWQVL